MKDIAAFIRCNRNARIRIFVDIAEFNKILKYLKKHKTHNSEFEEIKELILEDLHIDEKYCDLRSFTNIDGYKIMILSRGKSKACILCKETKEGIYRNIILIKFFTGAPEIIGDSIRDQIVNKGGYDYEFEK